MNRARIFKRVAQALFVMSGMLMGGGVASAQSYTISGFIEDAASGERLIGANLYEPTRQLGTTSNVYGFFSLTLPAGQYQVRVSYIGYSSTVVDLNLIQNVEMTVRLSASAETLGEIEVVEERVEPIEEESQMSKIDVPIAQILSTPSILGETDVLKTLQLLPGVQSGSEGTSGIYVRGGGPDQNLILLDGAPVYNVSHLFGYLSVFNADALNNVSLIKGGFPARYGGRLSSVVDINMKEGNMRKFGGTGSIGLVASRLTLEGPIIKDRTSFLVSARRTYIDLFMRPLTRASIRANDEGADGSVGYYFYDFNAKINHRVSSKDRLFLSFYAGNDAGDVVGSTEYNYPVDGGTEKVRDETDAGLNWGNVTSTLRWNHVWSSKIFSNASLIFSRYRFGIGLQEEINVTPPVDAARREFYALTYGSGIRDYAGKLDFDYIPNPNHYFRFGTSVTHHQFDPGEGKYKQEITNEDPIDLTFSGNDKVTAVEGAVYAEDDFSLSSKLKVNAGVHGSYFLVGKADYYSVQPRLSARYLVSDNVSVKAAFVTMTQYIHLLSNVGIGLPTDLWLPVTERVKPQHAVQFSAGIARSVPESGLELSIEGYYKRMNNVIEYLEGSDFLGLTGNWQDNIEAGKAESYGVEFFAQKKTGRMTGWVGYTLAWTNRTFPTVNFGETFPYRYDRRHDIAVVVSYRFSDEFELAWNWVFGTGNAVTLPIAKYQIANPRPGVPGTNQYQRQLKDYGGRNDFRMASYHRMDVGINYTRETRRGEWTFSFGAYNAYNRANPFYIYESSDTRGKPVFKQASLFPIIPAVTFGFTF